jgi:membrane protein DedA with SNARE-associated domain
VADSASTAVGAAGSATGGGVAGVLGLLVLTECGLPLPVPADLLMLLVGQQAAAGTLPLWLAAVAFVAVAAVGTTAGFLLARGPGRTALARVGPRVGLGPDRVARVTDLVVRRGRPMLTLGRLTPGLRTLTVVAAASAVPAGIALPLLVLGSTLFLEAHLLLGYALGATASQVLDTAGPVVVAVVVLLAVAALATALIRRRSARLRAGTDARPDDGADLHTWTEAACPACLVVTAVTAVTAVRRSTTGVFSPRETC